MYMYNVIVLLLLVITKLIMYYGYITVSDYSFEYISIISSLVVFVVSTTVIQKTTFGFKVNPQSNNYTMTL